MNSGQSSKICGLLLTGGKSARFGSAKGDAQLDGRSLNAIALTRLNRTCAHTAVAGPPSDSTEDCQHVADSDFPASGPLNGILAGLQWAHALGAQHLLVTPCDMPLVPAELTQRLIDHAVSSHSPLTALKGPDGLQPLCSVWTTDLTETLKAALANEHPPIWKLSARLGASELTEPNADSLLNINTRADLETAEGLKEHHWWRKESPD